MTPHELAHELEKVYGAELKSVILYGSAAGADYSDRYSDFNVFCVLSSPTPALLARANGAVRKWVKKGNPPPHFFGPEHIERSLDVFPIEFLDMQEQHKVIFGSDPLARVSPDPRHLRHQIESEMKGKLLHLRAFYAATCNKPKEIAKATVASFPNFLAAFRAVLRLVGEKPPTDARATIELLSVQTNIDPQVFLDIVDVRRGASILPRGDDALAMFERYITELEALTGYIDRLAP